MFLEGSRTGSIEIFVRSRLTHLLDRQFAWPMCGRFEKGNHPEANRHWPWHPVFGPDED